MDKQIPHIDFDDERASHRIMVTGGPGFGITTTIEHLAAMGFDTVPEAARQVIRRERRKPNPTALPWMDRAAFDEAIVELKVRDYEAVADDRLTFFDRGLPDLVGWSWYYQKSYEPFLDRIVRHPYQRVVFFTVPWRDIYQQNAERPLSFEEAKAVHQLLVKSYQAMGFQIVELARETPHARAQQILDTL